MKNFTMKVFSGVGIVAAIAVLYFVSPLSPNRAHADNGRIITIYHDGEQQVIATDAETVGEALDRAGVKIDQNDAVEPAKDVKLLARSYDINVYRARPVTVVDGSHRYRIMSPYQSAKEIAKSAGLEVYDEDKLTISRIDNFVSEGGAGLMLTIGRSTPLHMVLYGKLVDVRTQAKTVRELLKEKGIAMAAQDGVSPGLDTPISADMTVDVYRDGEQTLSVEQEIAFTTKQIQDADQPTGYKKVETPGQKGKKIVTFQVELKNGKEVSRKEIQSVVTVQPKEQVEIVGSKPAFSGDFGAALAKLRSCEGGYSSWNPAGPYYGAYQFDRGTWGSVADPAKYGNATPAEQDEAAHKLYLRRGWRPWPVCGAGLPDIYR